MSRRARKQLIPAVLGTVVPSNALTINGVPLTIDGQYLTISG